MAFKLTKTKLKERDEFVASLEIAGTELDAAIVAANEKIGEINTAMETAIAAYNEKLEAVREWREALTEAAQTEYDEKSENWQEGDRGGAASSWIEAWNDLDLDDLEDVTLDKIEEIELTHRDSLEEAPEEAEG